jgi:hypothetical protein
MFRHGTEFADFCMAPFYLFRNRGGSRFVLSWRRKTAVWNRRRIAMSDPRYTDPRLSDPVLRRDEGVGGPWGWIAGLAVLALVAFLVIAGWNSSPNTANNNSPPATTGTATRNISPPASTTGSGAMSPQPLPPAPSKSGAQ